VTSTQDGAARAAVEVRMSGLTRRYGPVTALDGLDLTLQPGELVALLGPSGCGKTTTLRLLAGLEDADEGRITVAGRDLTHVPASKRDMGMVFQAYSLFPHMTVQQNVAFGLRLRGVSKDDRDRRALEILDLVGLSEQAGRYAHQISGGQQQRVALARALAIADRVGVMRNGRLEQLAPPTEVYSRPATAFVAEFVGLTNRLAGTVSGTVVTVRGRDLPLVDQSTPPGPVTALVRPEAVTLAADSAAESGPLTGTVITTTFLGATSRVTVDLGDTTILAQLPTSDASELTAGSRVTLAIRPDPVLVSAGAPAVSEA
jgi:putative spermidine/putrescine transport system ATP-binding protein